jgi:hypothetical protein
MDAKLNPAAGLSRRGVSHRGDVVAYGVLAIGAVLAAFALLIVVRRLAGALERPAPAAVLLGTAVVIGAFAYLGRRLWRAARSPLGADAGETWSDPLVAWGPSVCLMLLTFGLSWPLGRFIDWLIWPPLWIADFVWRVRFLANVPRRRHDMAKLRRAGPATEPGQDAGVNLDEPQTALDEHVVLQRLTRFRDPHGRESLSGSLRAEFAPGERTVQIYVSFCPPFDGSPTVEVEQSEGSPARITVGHVRPHGARIEVRLAVESATASYVAVELFGACPEPRCTSISTAV